MKLIEEAITEHWGERCPEVSEGCPCCDAWAEYDRLIAPASIPAGLDAVDMDMIQRGDRLGPELGARVASTLLSLSARVGELEKALEPFARFIIHHDSPNVLLTAREAVKADDYVILRPSHGYPPMRLGHFRAARRAYEGGNGNG